MADTPPNPGQRTPDQNAPDQNRGRNRDRNREPREMSEKERRKREAAERARRKREAIEAHKAQEKALDDAFVAAGGAGERDPGTFSESTPGPRPPAKKSEGWVAERWGDYLAYRRMVKEQGVARDHAKAWWLQKNAFFPRFHGKGLGRIDNLIGSVALAGAGVFFRAAKLLERGMLVVENLLAGKSFPWLPGGKREGPEIVGSLHDEDMDRAA